MGNIARTDKYHNKMITFEYTLQLQNKIPNFPTRIKTNFSRLSIILKSNIVYELYFYFYLYRQIRLENSKILDQRISNISRKITSNYYSIKHYRLKELRFNHQLKHIPDLILYKQIELQTAVLLMKFKSQRNLLLDINITNYTLAKVGPALYKISRPISLLNSN